ncbi:hypothetical protein QYF36_000634 [Acer negundo]|nr:hypothetical protein QYF36_000634 [Acer negundo]
MADSRSRMVSAANEIMALWRRGVVERDRTVDSGKKSDEDIVIWVDKADRKSPRETHRSLERSLAGIRIVEINLRNGNPDQNLLVLDSGEPPHPVVLDESSDFVVIRDIASDGSKPVIRTVLLLEPDETCGPIVTHLD